MDKETLEAFMQPFTGEIRVRCVFPDGSKADFMGVMYGIEDGEGVVYLELSDE